MTQRATMLGLLDLAPLPVAYTELVLCRDIYHCPPNTLDALSFRRVAAHLAALRAERQWQTLMSEHYRKLKR